MAERGDGPWYAEMQFLGFNYRITDFQCALGSSQLKKLDRFNQRRREIAAYVAEGSIPPIPLANGPCCLPTFIGDPRAQFVQMAVQVSP